MCLKFKTISQAKKQWNRNKSSLCHSPLRYAFGDMFISRAPTVGSVGKNIPTVGTNSDTSFVNNAM